MKICTICKKEKPREEFNKHKGRRDGLDNKCRSCNASACRKWNRENSDFVRQYNASRYSKNKEQIKARVKQWVSENPERRSENVRRAKEANPEKYRAYGSQWASKNKIKKNEFAKQWRSRNHAACRIHRHNRRARERAAAGKISRQDVERLMILQKGKCASCLTGINRAYHVDHIEPLARGGGNERHNLQLLCPPCNLSKNAKDPFDWARLNGRLL